MIPYHALFNLQDMVIKNEDNAVEVEITGYAFPNPTWDEYDRNWLSVTVIITSDGEINKMSAPALLTWEVQRLVAFFREGYEASEGEKSIDFSKQDLSFVLYPEKSDGTKLLQVNLSGDFALPQNKPGIIFCEVRKDDLERVADDLQKDLVKYPFKQ